MGQSYFRRVTHVHLSGYVINSPPLTVHYDLPFGGDSTDAPVGDVQIYNLGRQTITGIQQRGPVSVVSGYRGDTGIVWLGIVQEARTERRGVDMVTVITTGDGTDRWLSVRVNRSWAAGTRASQVARDLAGILGLEVGVLKVPRDVVYARGKTFSCTVKAALEELAQDTGAKLYVSQGAVHLMPVSQGKALAVVLSAATGLLSSPQPVKANEDTDDASTKGTWSIECLLQHRITTDSLVQVESNTANGLYRVVSGKHSSDGSRHVTELEVVEA